MRVAIFQGRIDVDPDLAFASAPWAGPPSTLRELALANGWPLLRRTESGEVVAELYGRPETRR